MFSITTMELSTSIPTPRASPDREMTFMVTPLKYIRTMAVRILIGMEHAITKVGRISRRNTKRIRIASTAPNTRFCSTEPITMSI